MTVQTFERPLSAEAMTQVMEGIMAGQRSEEEIRAFLTALARRGETAEEIAAAVQVLRAHVVRLPLSQPYELCDTCGTGGDGHDTFNISTVAALVAAAAGVRVAKHGNRAASSRCGSADLMEALGVNLQATAAAVARCVEEVGFGFCFAPAFHPAMKAVAPIRKVLGIRTIFNLIGPLANPARLTFQLVGVADPRLLYPMAEALARLGVRHGMVVHGQDGLDEVTTTGLTSFVEVRQATMRQGELDPATLGLTPARLSDVRGGDAAQNASLARQLLGHQAVGADAQTPSALRDIIVLNAGCAIYVADHASSLAEAVALARRALASGNALAILERVKAITHAG